MGGLFSSKSKSTSTTKGTNVTEPQVPANYQAALDRILAEAQAVYATPFQPFTGNAVAGLSADERAAYAGIREMQGENDPLYDSLRSLLMSETTRLAGDEYGLPSESVLKSIMNPYQQNVTDIALREIGEFSDSMLNKLQRQVALSGGAGGTRGALMESELLRNTLQQLSDTQYIGSRDSYESAYDKFFRSKELRRGDLNDTVASALNLGGASTMNKLKELAALEGAGRSARSIAQASLDFGVNEFARKEAYPRDMLNFLGNIVYGYPTNLFPVKETVNQTTNTTTKGSSSPFSSLLGLGSMLAAPFTGGTSLLGGLAGGVSTASLGLMGASALGNLASGSPTVYGVGRPLKSGGLVRGYKKGGIVKKYKDMMSKYAQGGLTDQLGAAIMEPRTSNQENLLMSLLNPSELSKEGLDPNKPLTGYKFGGSVLSVALRESMDRLNAKKAETPVATTPVESIYNASNYWNNTNGNNGNNGNRGERFRNILDQLRNYHQQNSGNSGTIRLDPMRQSPLQNVLYDWDTYDTRKYPSEWNAYYKKGKLVKPIKGYAEGGSILSGTPLWKLLLGITQEDMKQMGEPIIGRTTTPLVVNTEGWSDQPMTGEQFKNLVAQMASQGALEDFDPSLGLSTATPVEAPKAPPASSKPQGKPVEASRGAPKGVTPKEVGSVLASMMVGKPLGTTGSAAEKPKSDIDKFFDSWMDNPLTKLGMNILAASEPGVPGMTAIGRGFKGFQEERTQEEDKIYERSMEQHEQALNDLLKQNQAWSMSPEGFREKARIEQENALERIRMEMEGRERIKAVGQDGSNSSMQRTQLTALQKLAEMGDQDALSLLRTLIGIQGDNSQSSDFVDFAN